MASNIDVSGTKHINNGMYSGKISLKILVSEYFKPIKPAEPPQFGNSSKI